MFCSNVLAESRRWNSDPTVEDGWGLWVWGEKRGDQQSRQGKKWKVLRLWETLEDFSSSLWILFFRGREAACSGSWEFLGEGRGENWVLSIQATGCWGEQRDPGRKVPRPSVGICLNSWGNPPPYAHPCLCSSGGRAESVCVLMWVCVCAGGRVYCIVMVCWGAGWAQNEGEGAEWSYFSTHSLPNPSRCILLF